MIVISLTKKTGDCGYDVATFSLFYHALKGDEQHQIKEALNTSNTLHNLLMLVMPEEAGESVSNSELLKSMIKKLQNKQIIASDCFNLFSSAMKIMCSESAWLRESTKKTLEYGYWYQTDIYKKSEEVNKLSRKIGRFIEADSLSFFRSEDKSETKLVFAQNYIQLMRKGELDSLITDIIENVYCSPDAHLDMDFLTHMDKMLFSENLLLFGNEFLKLDSSGSFTDAHWRLCLKTEDDAFFSLKTAIPSFIETYSLFTPNTNTSSLNVL